ncbi:flagellar basal body P-ring protein FlgI [Bradyrhizobium sp. U87765 SZCCT0131]|uniref:flagellar basal body P-ring protein FlgI n=1 Tax=unclassified Bradyrhizobium TaxID=2631580 RepID=UPI001BA9945B|nr:MULTISPECIES: flagellar basal body P-ring protein FlgI [unclassified Bradyrhizobium]MBR1216391.1 flagellar basal body P-ring protein FlgI [Bradyrhizobium sp. U87765 SZCCT0131]MBR1259861.1 flagellar basal body P-ring protein FlgI [Bradyrhizobium sp. U87765 SZCCT0134]MBR1305994.1 flagellar basal body P-ring protein FlgI [Bradyrhizobium sp. U87765 SZCCT0110]MBR1322361.1 flagellar basal body P-ring protein FlgI [Bradyrhizobium sp. U87765 SZCCT0109]MBR1352348.1 flagellar basal body P-ring protei
MWRLLAVAVLLLCATAADAAVRIKDIAHLKGVRENQLIGYGLVVGLKGTGDTLRNAPFTEQSLQSMLDNMGINIRGTLLRTRNVAAVVVTADLPPFAAGGSRVDIALSSLGDASSLLGGTLLMTQLRGADGEVYAVGQGAIAVGGYSVEGAAQTVSQGVPTSGRIPNGALIEREVRGQFRQMESLILELKNPDFVTATRIIDAINVYGQGRYRASMAFERDYRTIVLSRPRAVSPVRFIAEVGELLVEPDTPARVVIDERTGTVVIGRNVQISTVAVTHGNLSVRITEAPIVSQPGPFSRKGETVVVPQTFIEANEPGAQIAILRGTDLQRLVRGLNQIGLKPTGIIAILQAIKAAGALQADLVIQ